jgi:hypothetical protein
VERYDLCILPDLVSSLQLEALLTSIRSQAFRTAATGFGGYALDQSGEVIYERHL